MYTLHPGDVIFTGTPEGVSPIEAGDQIVATIESIGTMDGGRARGRCGQRRVGDEPAARLPRQRG